jgi:hypothetical protein
MGGLSVDISINGIFQMEDTDSRPSPVRAFKNTVKINKFDHKSYDCKCEKNDMRVSLQKLSSEIHRFRGRLLKE